MEKGSKFFDDIINNAKSFVKKQKGNWDNAKWEKFLSDIQKKGTTISEESTEFLGSALDSLKDFYNTYAAEKVKGGTSLFDEIITSAKQFVEEQKGKWDHTQWESFLSDLQDKGVSITEEIKNSIGDILESLKGLYTSSTETKKDPS